MKNRPVVAYSEVVDYIFNIIDRGRYLTEDDILKKVVSKFKNMEFNDLEFLVLKCLEHSKLRKLYYLYGEIDNETR